MEVNQTWQTAELGLARVHTTAAHLGWPYRQQDAHDYGIDVHIEPIEDGTVLGKLIALQVKAGESWFREWSKEFGWWVFRSDQKHLDYWLNHVLPVIVVMYDPTTDMAYWQIVATHTVRLTEKGFVLPIPQDQPFTVEARAVLLGVAVRRDETALSHFEHNLGYLPAGSATSLRTAADTDRVGAALAAEQLSDGRREPRLTATALLGGTPTWLTESVAVGELWDAIAAYLDEHEIYHDAGMAYLNAAEVGGESAARRLAFAGLSFKAAGEREAAREPLEHALSQSARLLREVGLAGLDRDLTDLNPLPLPLAVAAATEAELEAEPTAAMFVVDQLVRASELDEPIRRTKRIAERYPGAPRVRVALAEQLGRRLGLTGGKGGGADFRDSERAAESALRDIRRWDGPSERALSFLLALYLTNGHASKAVAAASPEPYGTATAREAANPEIALQGGTAALVSGNAEALARFDQALEGDPNQLVLAVQRLEVTGETDKLPAALIAAFAAARDDHERSRLIGRMASLGSWPIPEVEDMRDRGVLPDVLYRILEVLAEAACNPDAALPKLRSLAAENPFAATRLLVLIEERSGPSAAADEAWRQHARWLNEEGISVLLADQLRRAGRNNEAAQLIHDLIVRPALPQDARIRMRGWLVAYEGQQGNWAESVALAENAATDGDADEDTQWNLIGGLWNSGRYGEARAALGQFGPRPIGKKELFLWGALHLGVPWHDDDVRTAIRLADENRDDPEIVALLLSLALREVMLDASAASTPPPSLPTRQPLDPELRNEVRAAIDRHGLTDRMLEEVPNTPEGLLRLIGPDHQDKAAQVSNLVERVRSGQATLGQVATRLNQPYSQVLVQRTVGIQPACDLLVLDAETSTAMDALGREWSVDLSSIVTSRLITSLGIDPLELGRPVISLAARADALRGRDALRSLTGASFLVTFDPRNGQAEARHLSVAETAVLVPRAIELDERLERVEAKLSGPLVVLPGLLPIRDEPWASSVQLASDEGSFLYADDVVLRQRAASVGIRSFGTVALIKAALAQNLIDESFASAALRRLLAEYVVDLPLTAADIISQAESDDWRPLAGAAPLLRVAFWRQNGTESTWRAISERAAVEGKDVLFAWTQAALVGSVAAARTERRVDAGAVIIAISLATAHGSGFNMSDRLGEIMEVTGTLVAPTGLRSRIRAALQAQLVGDPNPEETARSILEEEPL